MSFDDKKPNWQKDDPDGRSFFDFDAFLNDEPPDAELGWVEEEPQQEPPEPPLQSQPVPPQRPALPVRPSVAPSGTPAQTVQPRPRIIITPPDSGYARQKRGGTAGKWVAACLIALAVVILCAVYIVRNLGAGVVPEVSPTPAVSETLSPQTPAAPTMQPQPTAQPALTATVTVTAGKGGTVSPIGTVTVAQGDSATFTMTADEGYVLSQLLVDGISVEPVGAYTFTKLSGSHTLYAVYALNATPVPTAQPTPEPTPEPTPVPTPEPTAVPTVEPPQTQEPSSVSDT